MSGISHSQKRKKKPDASKEVPRGPRVRCWQWTYQNPQIQGETLQLALTGKVQYYMYQLEAGEETGTPHFQGMFIFIKAVHDSTVQTLLNTGKHEHTEPLKFTSDDLRAYCSKEETRQGGPWEGGEFESIKGPLARGNKGKSNLLRERLLKLQPGQDSRELFLDCPDVWVRTYRGIQAWADSLVIRRHPILGADVSIGLIYGLPGLGKSTLARCIRSELSLFVKPSGRGFYFNGYKGEPKMLVDNFVGQYQQWTSDEFCQLTDRWHVDLPTKLGTRSLGYTAPRRVSPRC